MSLYLQLALGVLLLSCVVMTLVWCRQLSTKNAGIVDGWWSYNFAFIALVYAFFGSGNVEIRIIMAAMVALWSLRLGTHLLIRNSTHQHEDTRYRKLREEYGSQVNFKMWRFFMYQAFSNVLLSIPFLLISFDSSQKLSATIWIGIAIWAIAIGGETLSDQQLKNFKKNPANKGKVCEVGLWNYSRHPNYFFEWLVWIGFAVTAWTAPYGWLAWICPVIMYLLLNKVTGIPMLEELAVASKGEAYKKYQRTTSAFFPWFKKKD